MGSGNELAEKAVCSRWLGMSEIQKKGRSRENCVQKKSGTTSNTKNMKSYLIKKLLHRKFEPKQEIRAV